MESKSICILVALLLITSSYAQTGDALFSQVFTLEAADNAIQSVSVCDDFLPNNSGQLGSVQLWMLFASGLPPTLTLSILEDNGSVNPNNATTIFNSSLSASITDTGDNLFGYDVYTVLCDLDESVMLSGSQRYWLELALPVGGYWICQEPLVFGSDLWVFDSGMYYTSESQFGTAYDTFFELYQPVSLQRNSWGSIKTSF